MTDSGATSSLSPLEWMSPSKALGRFKLDAPVPGEELAFGVENSERQELRHGIKIGPFSILLPAAIVSEVVKGAIIYPVPKTANWVKGLINLRGNLVPVFDIARFFDPAASAPQSAILLAVGKAADAFGLIVDGVPTLASTAQAVAHASLPLPDELRNHLRGAYVQNDQMWLELGFPDLLESLAAQMGE